MSQTLQESWSDVSSYVTDAWSEFHDYHGNCSQLVKSVCLEDKDMKAYFSLGWVQYKENALFQSHDLIVQEKLL